MAREREKVEGSHTLIQTFGGNTLLPRDAWVWVGVGDGIARKKVMHLKPNDLVLEHRQRVDVSLHDIKQALLEDDATYRAAHSQLYFHPPGEELPVTRLQEYLSHAFGVSRQDLLDPSVRRQVVNRIRQRLSRTDRVAGNVFKERKTTVLTRAEDSIEDWTSGRTVLPSNALVVRLLRHFSPERFDELFGQPQTLKPRPGQPLENYPLLWSHKFWHTTHATLRNWVAGFSPRALESEKEAFAIPDEDEAKTEADTESEAQTPARARQDLTEQRRIVYDRLLKPICHRLSKEYALIRVKEVTPVTNKKRDEVRTRQAPTLSKGVLPVSKITPEELHARELSFADLHREYCILSHAVNKVLNSFTVHLADGRLEAGYGMTVTSAIDEEKRIAALPAGAVVGLPYSSQHGTSIALLTREEALRLSRDAMTKLASGELDGKAGLAKGTLLKVFQYSSELGRKMPKLDLQTLHTETSQFAERVRLAGGASGFRRPTPEQIKRWDKIAKEAAAYGIPPNGMFIPDFFEGVSIEEYSKLVESMNALEAHLGFTLQPYSQPLTEQQVRTPLERLELPKADVERLIALFGKRNFIPSKALSA